VTGVIAAGLVISISTVAFATGNSNGENNRQNTKAASCPDKQGPKSDGRDSGQKFGNPHDNVDTTAITAEIATLTDETTKTNLTALLTTYENALAAEKAAITANSDEATLKADREATQTALKALMDAAKTAGLTIADDSHDMKQDRIDTTAIATAIAALTDETTKTNLTALLTTYENALAAEKAAITANSDEATLKADREATQAACKALMDAVKTAGIVISK
jgi:hypothetical protein